MGSGSLALDTIVSAALFFAGKWTPALKHNQSRDLLRFLILRLYDEGRGQLVNAQLTLAQGTLARKLGLSRQWVGVLLERLRDAGWIEYAAPVLEGGMRGSTIFRIGRQLKRLLVMLLKTKKRKTPATAAANRAWQFSPSFEEKRQQTIQERENRPPKPELLKKMPLLRQWMERGKGRNENSEEKEAGENQGNRQGSTVPAGQQERRGNRYSWLASVFPESSSNTLTRSS